MGVLVLNGLYRLADKALYTPPAAPPGDAYPSDAAAGYAVRFASAYLSWDESKPSARAQALDAFFPGNGDSGMLGWDGKGIQRVLGQPVSAGVRASDAHHGLVNVAADLDPGGWTCMQVAVYAGGGGTSFAISSYTAFVSCPRAATPSMPAETRDSDDPLTNRLRPTVTSFLKSYAASDAGLAQLTTPESAIVGLGGEVQFGQLVKLFVPAVKHGADATRRDVTVQVQWLTTSGGRLTQEYRLAIEEIGDRWFVSRVDGGVPAQLMPGTGQDEPPADTDGTPSPSTAPSTSGSPQPGSSSGKRGDRSPTPKR